MSEIAVRFHITVEPRKIIYVNGVLDSYENIGLMRTADEHAGKIVIYSTKDYESVVNTMLTALRNEGVRLEIDYIDNVDEVF